MEPSPILNGWDNWDEPILSLKTVGAVRMYRILMFAAAILFLCALILLSTKGNQTSPLPNPPELRAHDHDLSVVLHAVADSSGRDAFAYNGHNVAPTLRISPGDTLQIDYVNDLPAKAKGSCAISPCMDMTNLHFHGLHVSPNAPQDDVLTMMAMPGQSLHYTVHIPQDHPPGLYWFHTHPHGESHRQVLDGMSGAIVIEGMERYVPEVHDLHERILIVRGRSISGDPQHASLLKRVGETGNSCGPQSEPPEEIFTVNGAIRPHIAIAPGERQFWRVVNASADRYIDLQLDGQHLRIVALDGVPIAYHDPAHPTRTASHFLVPPAGRVEAIVTGPPSDAHATLRSLCVNTGADGDPNPGMILADVVPGVPATPLIPKSRRALDPPPYRVVDLQAEEKSDPAFVATFTEDKKGFYINGQLYKPDSAPMREAHVGTYEHWRIVNATKELHPMHIHQVHFLAFEENQRPVKDPVWLDTVNVPVGGSVDVVMDFTDPVIRGMSLFHCHLLNHEDKGMMAKILFE
jgi:FtsP/CotA-like multicopper oxidase with cupredoxin domain